MKNKKNTNKIIILIIIITISIVALVTIKSQKSNIYLPVDGKSLEVARLNSNGTIIISNPHNKNILLMSGKITKDNTCNFEINQEIKQYSIKYIQTNCNLIKGEVYTVNIQTDFVNISNKQITR